MTKEPQTIAGGQPRRATRARRSPPPALGSLGSVAVLSVAAAVSATLGGCAPRDHRPLIVPTTEQPAADGTPPSNSPPGAPVTNAQAAQGAPGTSAGTPGVSPNAPGTSPHAPGTAAGAPSPNSPGTPSGTPSASGGSGAPGAPGAPGGSLAAEPRGAPLPELRVKSFGLHVGGAARDAAARAEFLRVLEAGWWRYLDCYRLLERPGVEGTFGADLTVPGEGGKARVAHPRTKLAGEPFRECMERAFASATFAAPPSGRSVVLSYSIKFTLAL